MERSKKTIRIFLIHAHADRKPVHKLYNRLVRDGVDAWMDVENLQPGQDWQNEIRKAILNSDAVIVCLTHAFDGRRGYRHEELKLALRKTRSLPDGDIFLMPVRLENCDMPRSLRHLHRVDLFERGGYRKLLQALHEDAESKS